jgi:hypothetical protein
MKTTTRCLAVTWPDNLDGLAKTGKPDFWKRACRQRTLSTAAGILTMNNSRVGFPGNLVGDSSPDLAGEDCTLTHLTCTGIWRSRGASSSRITAGLLSYCLGNRDKAGYLPSSAVKESRAAEGEGWHEKTHHTSCLDNVTIVRREFDTRQTLTVPHFWGLPRPDKIWQCLMSARQKLYCQGLMSVKLPTYDGMSKKSLGDEVEITG